MPLSIIGALLLSFSSPFNLSVAAAQTEKDSFETKIVIADENGTPVIGATVIVHPGYSIDNETYIPKAKHLNLPTITTNASGIASITLPRILELDVIRNGLPIELSKLGIEVKHDEFMKHQGQWAALKTTYRVALKRGVQLAIDAVNADGEKLTEGLYGMTPNQQAGDWKRHPNGLLVSPNLPRQKLPLRIVQATDGSPTLFSKEFIVDPGAEHKVLMRDVKLQPGVRVEGKLDDAVPRPVRHGLVTVHILGAEMEPTDGETPGTTKQILWSDFAKVQSDGTFVFESLPRNSAAQFFANCEGWTSRASDFEELKELFPKHADALTDKRGPKSCMPHVVTLGKQTQTTTIAMNRTCGLKVRVMDFDGNALSRVKLEYRVLHCLGNGKMLRNLIASTRHNLMTGDSRPKCPVDRGHRFGAIVTLDENGEANLTDYRIPVPQIFVISPKFTTIDINGDDGDGVLELQVTQPDREVTVINVSSAYNYFDVKWGPSGASYAFDDFIKSRLDVDRY